MLWIFAILLTLRGVLAQYNVNFDKSSYGAGDSIQVTWQDSGGVDLSQQTVGQLLLCTCNSSSAFHCTNMKSDMDLKGSTSVTIPVSSIQTLGPDGQYLLQMASTSTSSKEYTLSYSHGWFTLSGMTGTGKADKDCNVPYGGAFNYPSTGTSSSISWTSWSVPEQYQTVPSYMIPYSVQAGPTRFAPPQPTPGTKVTQTVTPTRRFPTSSVTLLTTYFINKYLPVTTTTATGISHTQYPNYVPSIQTTPSGSNVARVVPPMSTGRAAGKGKRRWA